MLTKKLERRIMSIATKPLRLLKNNRKGKGRRVNRADDGDEQQEQKAEEEEEEEKEEQEEEEEEQEEEKEEQEEEEQKDDTGTGPGTIVGYAAVFHSEADPGTEYELWSDPAMRAVERIARGAFSRAVKEGDDCRACFNHDPNMLLGRTSSGTLRLSEDETGLRYENDLPDTQLARDVAELVDRGDVNGSSFGFVVEQESWRESEEPDGKRVAVRTIESVRLLDVGPVTYPAYASTTTGREGDDNQGEQNNDGDVPAEAKSRSRALGSVAEARASYDAWKQRGERDGLPLGAKLAAVRARAVQVATAAAKA